MVRFIRSNQIIDRIIHVLTIENVCRHCVVCVDGNRGEDEHEKFVSTLTRKAHKILDETMKLNQTFFHQRITTNYTLIFTNKKKDNSNNNESCTRLELILTYI